jgi:MoxR-like ATPase
MNHDEVLTPETETSVSSEQLNATNELIGNFRKELSKAIIGQQSVIDQVLTGLFASGHVLIEGVPGLGKTLLVRALARCFNGQFSRIQLTPDLMPSDVTGHVIYDMKSSKFTLRKGPIFTHLLLADEINRAPAKTQSALLEIMQESQVTIEGKALDVPKPFMTLATQNPLEQEGTYPLPEAQLDRFLLKILIDYPSEIEEQQLVSHVTNGQVGDDLNVDQITSFLSPENVTKIQKLCARIQVDSEVNAYAVRIIRTTREWQGISVGAGPRGAISLIRAARATALLAGRDFVSPDDVKSIALPALRHRITLAPELELEGHDADHVLTALLDSVEAPRK